jgi:hypothetical protein
MYEGFNWRRVLAFAPVMVALALLTVDGPHFIPHYLILPIGVVLFVCLFLIHYSLPRWKPALRRPVSTRMRLVLLVLSWSAIAFIGVSWIEWRFPHQVLPWLAFLLSFAAFLHFAFSKPTFAEVIPVKLRCNPTRERWAENQEGARYSDLNIHHSVKPPTPRRRRLDLNLFSPVSPYQSHIGSKRIYGSAPPSNLAGSVR